VQFPNFQICERGLEIAPKAMCFLEISPQAHADEQHKHHMNQMVVYKKQLATPLMMGL